MRNQEHNTNDRMESLDGLRGVAALIVVFTHAMLLQPFYWAFITGASQEQQTMLDWVILNSPIRILFGGDKAVTLFFVLSGFVLALPWLKGRQLPYRSFVISRLCRIYLPYLAAMTFAAVFAFTLGGEKIPGATDWVNIYAWTNNYSPLDIPSVILMLGNDYSTWFVNPTWSLVWEMRVSLLFPLLVIPVIRWGLRGTVAVGLGLWGAYMLGTWVAGLFPAAASMVGQPPKPDHAHFCAGQWDRLLGVGYCWLGGMDKKLGIPTGVYEGGRSGSDIGGMRIERFAAALA